MRFDKILSKKFIIIQQRAKSLFFLLITTSVLMNASGCVSAVTKLTTWPADTHGTEWIPFKLYDETHYKFQYENVSVDIVFFFPYKHQLTWVGPPIFPVIPLPSSLSEQSGSQPQSLYMHLKIMSPTHQTSLDFSETLLEVSESETLQIDQAKAAEEYMEEYPDLVMKYQEIPVGKVVISQGKMDYSLTFHPFDSEPQTFLINLGCIQVNDKKVQLPPLKVHKNFKNVYKPLALPEHGF